MGKTISNFDELCTRKAEAGGRYHIKLNNNELIAAYNGRPTNNGRVNLCPLSARIENFMSNRQSKWRHSRFIMREFKCKSPSFVLRQRVNSALFLTGILNSNFELTAGIFKLFCLFKKTYRMCYFKNTVNFPALLPQTDKWRANKKRKKKEISLFYFQISRSSSLAVTGNREIRRRLWFERLAGYNVAWNRLFVCLAVKLLRIVNVRVWPALTTKSEQMDGDQKTRLVIKKLMWIKSNNSVLETDV